MSAPGQQHVTDIKLMPHQMSTLMSPYQHTALFGGVAAGKTYTGANYAIMNVLEHPELTGFIGANTYDQLAQATLRVLFEMLEEQGPRLRDRPAAASELGRDAPHVQDV